MHQPEDGQQIARQLRRAGRPVRKRRRRVRDERPDAHHLRYKFLDELEVRRQVLRRLIRRADHEPAAHLIAQTLEITQAAHAPLKGHLPRVKPRIVRGAGRLVAQQVAVRARLAQARKALVAPLTQGQRHRAVRIARLDRAHNVLNPFVGEESVLAALHHERAKAQRVALLAAGQNVVLPKPVARAACVAAADSAVQAVVFADVADLDQPADEHAVAVGLPPNRIRAPGQQRRRFRVPPVDQLRIFLQAQRMALAELACQRPDCLSHGRSRWRTRSSRSRPPSCRSCPRARRSCPAARPARWR